MNVDKSDIVGVISSLSRNQWETRSLRGIVKDTGLDGNKVLHILSKLVGAGLMTINQGYYRLGANDSSAIATDDQ